MEFSFGRTAVVVLYIWTAHYGNPIFFIWISSTCRALIPPWILQDNFGLPWGTTIIPSYSHTPWDTDCSNTLIRVFHHESFWLQPKGLVLFSIRALTCCTRSFNHGHEPSQGCIWLLSSWNNLSQSTIDSSSTALFWRNSAARTDAALRQCVSINQDVDLKLMRSWSFVA